MNNKITCEDFCKLVKTNLLNDQISIRYIEVSPHINDFCSSPLLDEMTRVRSTTETVTLTIIYDRYIGGSSESDDIGSDAK